jgi:hypothetical protein
MKLIYDEFQEHWIWVSVQDENNELSPAFDESEYAIKWLFDIRAAFAHVNYN